MNFLYKELRIPSSLDSLNRVEKFVEEICDTYYITNSYYGNILLTVEEAVKNAVIHGNKMDEKKQVLLTFQRKPAGLSFTVTDEGGGFNYLAVPNPLDLDDRAAESAGKGIFLIRSLADATRYNAKGNTIEIVFTVSSINREVSLKRAEKLTRYFATNKSIAK
ncbi:MAG TPA: ATP-binding protein [Bacteroidales bacterium]|nr:ATP-binding protein [Bacteroidales bacterium]